MLLYTEPFFPFFPITMHSSPSMVLLPDCLLWMLCHSCVSCFISQAIKNGENKRSIFCQLSESNWFIRLSEEQWSWHEVGVKTTAQERQETLPCFRGNKALTKACTWWNLTLWCSDVIANFVTPWHSSVKMICTSLRDSHRRFLFSRSFWNWGDTKGATLLAGLRRQ